MKPPKQPQQDGSPRPEKPKRERAFRRRKQKPHEAPPPKQPKSDRKSRRALHFGFIAPGVLYTADAAKARLGFKVWGWRSLRRKGLRVMYEGGRAFVNGDDIIAYFKSKLDTDPSGKDGAHD